LSARDELHDRIKINSDKHLPQINRRAAQNLAPFRAGFPTKGLTHVSQITPLLGPMQS
jgi:hypothetical protein